ncbi:hypothetical protein [Ureibacillus chungkukjangi]|uniref:DUF3953 domain-containing protein n=1 Tax=Ureibacillus chungkukjangi TaxID=1202712 RepID=A0A318TPI5_9BACL|nr:hypothetical protein [Ureibacillus chungkukjangi]PYF05807.1 hypothetical protein BJ095_11577 [Ureibacillus chungkukjangi]
MKLTRILLPILVVALSLYSIITMDYRFSSVGQLLLGIFFFITGYDDIKNKKTGWGGYFIGGGLLIILMSIFSF